MGGVAVAADGRGRHGQGVQLRRLGGGAEERVQVGEVDDLHYSGTVALGVDTFFGPLYLASGHADGGRDAMYLSLGRSFACRRLFGLGH